MNWIFWISFLLLAYTYLGYALWLWLYQQWCFRPVDKRAITPSVSIVIAAHNEAAVLPRKLNNLSQLEYPQELLEIIVVSDGSTDDTDQILKSASTPNFLSLSLSTFRKGSRVESGHRDRKRGCHCLHGCTTGNRA